jgi:uncharacterized membrane protein
MSGSELGLALSVFLACAVEAVEALTIVVAVGSTRSWRSAMSGVGAAIVVLAAIVAALGPALTSLPIDALRVLVGGLLLIFGLQWLRKAILRSAGLKAKHDELETYQQELQAARAAGARRGRLDGYSLTIAFKGVLLEGLEVAFIVLTFGANQHRIPLAAAAAGVAVLVVLAAGFAVRGPLAREHAEVRGRRDAQLVRDLLGSRGRRGTLARQRCGAPGDHSGPADRIQCDGLEHPARRAASPRREGSVLRRSHRTGDLGRMMRTRALLLGVWDFVVGDDWRAAIGVVLALGLTAVAAAADVTAWWIMPLSVLAILALSLRRAARGASRRG